MNKTQILLCSLHKIFPRLEECLGWTGARPHAAQSLTASSRIAMAWRDFPFLLKAGMNNYLPKSRADCAITCLKPCFSFKKRFGLK